MSRPPGWTRPPCHTGAGCGDHRSSARSPAARDLLGGQAPGQQAEHFALPFGKPGRPGAARGRPFPGLGYPGLAFPGLVPRWRALGRHPHGRARLWLARGGQHRVHGVGCEPPRIRLPAQFAGRGPGGQRPPVGLGSPIA